MIARRTLLTGTASLAAALTAPHIARAQSEPSVFAPRPGAWKTYEIRTTLDLSDAKGGIQAWVPVPSFASEDWIKPGETTWVVPAGQARLVRDAKSGAAMVYVEFDGKATSGTVEVISQFSARDRLVEPGKSAATLSASDRARYLSATELQPLDGIVKTTADTITKGARTDIEKAAKIYEWIVDNTFRNAKTRGCGTGDIATMLKTGNLSGKCADLNALFVGLARASGLPARDLYGIRVAASQFGYKSLGANSPAITKAQHCRAEVFIEGTGWLPVDPADVRKVVLEEPPGNLALADAKVVAARKALFGSWESNWLAYNDAHDIALPNSTLTVPFLMYPQAQTASGLLDHLEPETFRYAIASRQVMA